MATNKRITSLKITVTKILAAFCLLLCILTQGFAQRHKIKFNHLRINDGLSQSDVTTITQDSKGLMWIGTRDGLNVYNGYKFEVFSHDLADTTSISNNVIHTILEYDDTTLLIGTADGLNIFHSPSQTFKNILKGESKNSVRSIAVSDNHIWAGTEDGVIRIDKDGFRARKMNLYLSVYAKQLKIRKLQFISRDELLIATEGNGLITYNISTKRSKQLYNENSEITSNVIWDFYVDTEDEIWLATNKGVYVYYRSKEDVASLDFVNNVTNNEVVKQIFRDKSGIIWLATENVGVYKIESHYYIDHYESDINIASSISSNKINTIYEDKSGIIWIGTQSGIDKFDKKKQYFKHYQHEPNTKTTINSNIVWSIFQDELDDAKLFIGTDKGLNIIDGITGSVKELIPDFTDIGLKKNKSVYSILKDHDGTIYLGTDGGLFYLKNDELKYFFDKTQGKSSRVYSIMEDLENRLWLGTAEGVVIISADRAQIETVLSSGKEKEALANDMIHVIVQSRDGTVWLGTNGGGLCKVTEKNGHFKFKTYKKHESNNNSLSNNSILSIYEDWNGTLWIGTFGGGLNKFDPRREEFIRYTEKDGLSNNVVYGILEDEQANLWLSTNKGISKFKMISEKFTNFEESDGLQSNEFSHGAYFKNKSGQLFFGGMSGFNSFYPEDIKINEHKPKALLTDFYLFNKPVKIGPDEVLKQHISELDELVLSHRQNVITFEFASIHYSYPAKNQHAYKLENFDDDWVYVGNERRANYTNLDPDEYTFKLKVANSDGIWSEEIEEIRVIIKPPFWKTWWFISLFVLFIAAVVYFYYVTRINRVKAQKQRLEIQVRERTYEVIKQKEEIEHQKKVIEEEQEKTEQLLRNILPEKTAIELKTKGKATPRQYQLASIMFTDFKSFTKIAEKLKPQELVAQLDSYFIKFDEIIEKYDIEKIKTIGDAYMCAGGIPIRNKSNPIDIVLAGLEIQRFVREYNKTIEKKGKKGWGLRIGIHTGEIIAGVVGIKRFAYDIWGDTVNIGSRIEAASNVGRVNISGATYELVKEFFVCEYRGKIRAKNKGQIDMYFVHSIRKELSVDGKGIVPNNLFKKYVDLHIYSSINYRKAEKYIIKRLEEELPEDLHYHDIRHTKDVCAAVERIALMEGIEGDDIFLLKTAALYHDAGFVKTYSNNEDVGAALAHEVLPQFGYSSEQIDKIGELIQATKVPQKPKNHLEQIICDADLDYLGGDEFHKTADKLKRELMEREMIKTEKQWDELQIKFLESHTYFTKTAIELRRENKLTRIKEIKERLKNYK